MLEFIEFLQLSFPNSWEHLLLVCANIDTDEFHKTIAI